MSTGRRHHRNAGERIFTDRRDVSRVLRDCRVAVGDETLGDVRFGRATGVIFLPATYLSGP